MVVSFYETIFLQIAKQDFALNHIYAILSSMKTILHFPRNNEIRQLNSLIVAIDDKYGFSVKFADIHICTAQEVAELLAFWRPKGCIVNNDALPVEAFTDYPTVFNHRAIEMGNPRHATLGFDEKAVAESAAHHLLSLNLASYAYVPSRANEEWSRTRERHFIHILGLNGHGIATYVHPRSRMSMPKQLAHLADWLADLPRPVGVFAANDIMAADVITACDHRQLAIPKDIAVLGVDNDESICEIIRPTLSSITTDVITAHSENNRLLELLISGHVPTCRHVTVKPLGVVRRTSTLRTDKHDSAVVAACDLIRRQACNGLKARDVAATFPCGRRMAEIRFRAMLGHSILDEIRAVRLARARMVTTPFRTKLRDEITALCGYASWSSVYRLLADERINVEDSGQ